MSTISRRVRTVATVAAPLLLAASSSLAADDHLRLARAAALLEQAGVSELALDLVSLETGVPLDELRGLDRPAIETARAAALTALTSIDLPLAHALLAGDDLSVMDVALRVGRSESEVRQELAAVARALEAGAVALGLLDVEHMHGEDGPGTPGGPGGDDPPEPCEPGQGPGPGPGPGHGPHHDDCEPGDPDGPGPGPGPGDDHHGPHEYEGEDCEHPESGLGPHGHGCPVEFAEDFTVEPFACVASDLVACSTQERFEVTVEWGDFEEEFGFGHRIDLPSPSSSLFWFFDDENYELLVKTLDGCAINGHFWVFGAATTNVEYALTVIDSVSGRGKTYFSPLHLRSRAIADVQAFPCP